MMATSRPSPWGVGAAAVRGGSHSLPRSPGVASILAQSGVASSNGGAPRLSGVRSSKTTRRVAAGVTTGSRRASDSANGLDDKVKQMEEEFGMDGFIVVQPGISGTPEVMLNHPNGSSVCIALEGGTVTSWKKPDGRELIYMPQQEFSYTGSTVQRGGISLAFPQFGYGALPHDGVLNGLQWEVVGSEAGEWDEEEIYDPCPGVCLRATDTAETRKLWPFSFEVNFQVNLMETDDLPPKHFGPHFRDPNWEDKWDSPNPYTAAPAEGEEGPGPIPEDDESPVWAPDEIEQQLRFLTLIKNTGDKPMEFTTGLRSLFSVKHMEDYGKYIRFLGLGGKYILDYVNTTLPKLRVQGEDFVTFGEKETDSIFVDAHGECDLFFCPGDRSFLSFHNREGFKDVSVWSPLESIPFESHYFVGIGSARVARVVTLQPGEEWYAESVYRSHDTYWDQMPGFMKNPGILQGLEHPPHNIGKGL
eukprot:CAMPEP_0117675508 /NCGR_PEP_ID=MMETSP0804-20121206/15646_1 /TAXON_ID=1074897 /ORGANISM="Tetraselmis astigmatica, Strain CCMP880" /LENGTH=473 /DNA_ID=CAMNT_0005484523 /DNA_START=359 /DNA_END=1780 /DNA_ORIENTATION=+